MLFVAGHPASAEEQLPDRVEVYKVIDDVSLSLRLFLPENHDVALARPAVVLFHGGAWITGRPESMYPQAEHLSSAGLVAISAEYRVRDRHGTTPYEAIRDAFDAMRYVRDHAAQWGVDPQRVAAGGSSAGGHLAAATATLVAEDLAGDAPSAARARPDALILYYPVYDNGPEGRFGHNTLKERWRDASPAHHLHPDMPPTLVILGTDDKHIPVSTAERFGNRLTELGVMNRLILYRMPRTVLPQRVTRSLTVHSRTRRLFSAAWGGSTGGSDRSIDPIVSLDPQPCFHVPTI